MSFQSERLLYRDFTIEDFPQFYALFSNPLVMRYAYLDAAQNERDIEPYFQSVLHNTAFPQERTAYEFAVFHKQNGSFAGFTDIMIHKQNSTGGCGELGYFLMPDYWGKGYATEIARTMVDFCFEHTHLHKLSATCNTNNLNSERVMRKAGMQSEGILRKVRFKEGRWVDEKQYGILREEWQQNKPGDR